MVIEAGRCLLRERAWLDAAAAGAVHGLIEVVTRQAATLRAPAANVAAHPYADLFAS